MNRIVIKKKKDFAAYVRDRKKQGWKYLEQARMLALSGDYNGAINRIGAYYWPYKYPSEAMRLHGNILELGCGAGVFDALSIKLARALYLKALEISPGDPYILEDLLENEQELAMR